MGEIRIIGPGKTHGYPYPVCKKYFYHQSLCCNVVSKKFCQSDDVASVLIRHCLSRAIDKWEYLLIIMDNIC